MEKGWVAVGKIRPSGCGVIDEYCFVEYPVLRSSEAFTIW